MFVIIDNSQDGLIKLSFVLDKKVVQNNFFVQAGANVVVCLDKALIKSKRQLSDLRGLGVVVGAGRFTATRLAVTAANTLAYALRVPVVALPADWSEADFYRVIKKAKAGIYALPRYSGEAHIGGKN